MGDAGYKLAALEVLDSGTVVSAGGTAWASSPSFGLGDNSSPQAVAADGQIGISNAGSTDGYDLEVRVQWSDNDTNWPDDGEGKIVGVWYSAVAGGDLTRSALRSLGRPKAAYGRLQYLNRNGTDNLTVTAEIAKHLLQS